jgi:hypothetical protein
MDQVTRMEGYEGSLKMGFKYYGRLPKDGFHI